jgi:DNA-binding CsgD family transcriptional regulator
VIGPQRPTIGDWQSRENDAVQTVGSEAQSPREALSPREAEVLDALADHLTNAEIGQQLYISARTVESHVASLRRKLGAADRRELATMAARIRARASAAPASIEGLPATWTSFVGRTVELDELAAALAGDRLVTLVGAGGIGKTRLAVEAVLRDALSFPGGGAFVDLVPVSAEYVVYAVAAALGVVELAHRPVEETVHERLRAGRTLLVLDNCEHVLPAVAGFVSAVLARCPATVVLATTRERLVLR